MSMLSAQIDELRELADDIESRYGYPTAVKALRYAADTIWQLRDDLQRTNAEYAKLRELVRELYEMAYPEYPSAFDAAFAGRMRELGIEVDG